MLNDADASGFKKVYLAMGFTVLVFYRLRSERMPKPIQKVLIF